MACASPHITIKGGFQAISVLEGHFRAASLEKGEKILLARHVAAVEEVRDERGKTVIRAQVAHSASVRQKPYNVELELDSDRCVSSGRCNCVAGITGNCKHAAAVFRYVNKERATGCTDNTQQWDAPPKKLQELYVKGETIEKILKVDSAPPLLFTMEEEEETNLVRQLEAVGLHNSALYKTLTKQKEPASSSPEETPLPEELQKLFFLPASPTFPASLSSSEAERAAAEGTAAEGTAKAPRVPLAPAAYGAEAEEIFYEQVRVQKCHFPSLICLFLDETTIKKYFPFFHRTSELVRRQQSEYAKKLLDKA